jgi:hypothetical protein
MTFVFGARGRIPQRVPLRARLQYSFTASDPRAPRRFAAVSAILLHDDWIIEVREGDDYRTLSDRPTSAGDVLEIVLEADDVPELMRGPFRWGALSEWAPAAPAGTPSEVFSDFCPNTGFPRFRGTSA